MFLVISTYCFDEIRGCSNKKVPGWKWCDFQEILIDTISPVKSYGFQYVEDDEIVEDFVQDVLS